MAASLAGRHYEYLAGQPLGGVGGLSRAALVGRGPGGRVSYFLKTSLIFSPACLR
jgi:hypothetical protein